MPLLFAFYRFAGEWWINQWTDDVDVLRPDHPSATLGKFGGSMLASWWTGMSVSALGPNPGSD